jgi:hypothetical protein
MIHDWQTPAALLVVLACATWLVRSWLAKRKNPGCGGSCACPTDTFKAKLKH